MLKIKDYPTTAAERYDRALSRSQARTNLPDQIPQPRPTADWPKENMMLLERYRDWLTNHGYATEVINQHRLPMAGHVLGLTLKPHDQIDLKTDFAKLIFHPLNRFEVSLVHP